jgi:hypothetical protein
MVLVVLILKYKFKASRDVRHLIYKQVNFLFAP